MEQETTANKTLVKENFVEISIDEINQIVIAKWVGYLRLEDIKKGCDGLVKVVKQHEIAKHISDQVDMKVLSKEAQDHLVQKVFPLLDQHGLRKLAVFVSNDVFAQATVNKVNTEVQMGNVQINTFNAYKDCLDQFKL